MLKNNDNRTLDTSSLESPLPLPLPHPPPPFPRRLLLSSPLPLNCGVACMNLMANLSSFFGTMTPYMSSWLDLCPEHPATVLLVPSIPLVSTF